MRTRKRTLVMTVVRERGCNFKKWSVIIFECNVLRSCWSRKDFAKRICVRTGLLRSQENMGPLRRGSKVLFRRKE